MKYLVIGRGFASYGYVPALAAMGREVWVPSVLFDRLQSRQFLDPADLLNVRRIETFDVELDAIVLAVRPSELQHYLSLLDDRLDSDISLLLEKPVGIAPQSSVRLLSNLRQRNIKFSVNYSFLWTSWYRDYQHIFETANHITCSWRFKSKFNPVNERWKSSHAEGGGALLFYGSHFLALFSHAQCIDVAHCSLTKTVWGEAVFTSQLTFLSCNGQKRQILDLEVNCQANEELFHIRADGLNICRHPDPFTNIDDPEGKPPSFVDRRFHILQDYIQTIESAGCPLAHADVAIATQQNLVAVFDALEIRYG